MDPIIGGAIISGLGSLFGGGKAARDERRAIAAQNEYNKPLNVRKRAEEGGFNPLLFVGPGVGQQTATGGSNFMGQAIADAGMMLGDAFARRGGSQAAKLNQYQQENDQLRQQVTSLTLRPKVGGIYAANETAPTRSEALGNDQGVSGSSGSRTSFGPAGPFDLSLGDPSVTSTHTVYQSPGVEAQTQLPEGVDAEDVLTGIGLDGINRAKADGNLPANFEQPFIEAGQNVAYGLAVALDRTHRSVYNGVRYLNPWHPYSKNTKNERRALGDGWWKHQPKGAW